MEKPTEYAALDFDGTERRANYRTVAYRIDILHLCERKDAAAILYEIIYRWQTEVRKPEIAKEIERRKKANLPPLTEEEVESLMWVWMSYNDFVRESGGAVAYNTVIRMLDYLVEDAKIIECRENHDPRYPDYEYRVRLDIVKQKLKALPPTPAFLPKVPKKKGKKDEESTQVGTVEKRSTQKGRRAQRSTQVGTDSTQNGIATTQVGTGVYPLGGTSHTTTHTSHIEHTEGTYSDIPENAPIGTDVPTPAPDASPSRIANDTPNTQGELNGQRSGVDATGYGDAGYSSGHPAHPGMASAADLTPGATQDGQREHADAASAVAQQQATQTAVASVPASGGGYTQATLTAGVEKPVSARVAPVDVTTLTIKAHVNLAFKWLDAVRQKAEKNPEASYVQNGSAEKLVRDLIGATMNTTNDLTERNIYIAWMAMWKSPAGKDGFTWGKPGGISIAAFCRNYGEYLARGRDSLAKSRQKRTDPPPPMSAIEILRAEQLRYAQTGGIQA